MMNTRRNLIVRVRVDHQAPYADPIQVNVDDEVVVDSDKQTDIAGWVWCTNSNGKSGWVPKTYVEFHGKVGEMRLEYDAIELTVQVGEILTVLKAESGFYWVVNRKNQQGWVPISHVEICENEQGSQ